MNASIAERAPDATAIEQALVGGDLSRLTPTQRVSYYNRVCESLGLNPLTKPFAYLTLNGKLILYALKDCTEQLRKLHGVSIVDVTATRLDDVYVVTAKALDKSGRTDASTGAVPIGNAKGEALANILMKAETKAKRRVTLSICGLGMLDETEIDSIDSAKPAYVVEPPALPEKREKPSAPNGGVSGEVAAAQLQTPAAVTQSSLAGSTASPKEPAPSDNGPDMGADLPAGARLITKVEAGVAGSKARVHFNAPLGDANKSDYLVFKDQLATLAAEFCQNATPCFAELKKSASGNWRIETLARVPADYDPPAGKAPVGPPITAEEIPF